MTVSAYVPAVDLIVKASLILLGTALAAAGLRRASAATRHLVWTLGLVGALAVPALSLAVPRWQVPIVTLQPSASPRTLSSDAVASRSLDPASPPVTAPRAAPPAFDAQVPDAPGSPDSSRSASSWSASSWSASSWSAGRMLLLVWLVGAVFVLARLVLGLTMVRVMCRRARLITGAAWLPQARAIAGDLGLRGVRFVRGRPASMPMACGVVRPLILMPNDADGWPEDRLRVVLLHELAHVKRRDCLTHVIGQIACAVYWFNPLAWVASKRLRIERERACDDLVLRAGARRTEYADQLLEIARVLQGDRFPGILGGATLAMAHRSQLEGRLMAILDPTVPRRNLSRARLLTAIGAAAVIVVALASVQPWAQEQTAPQVLPTPSVVAAQPVKQAAQDPQPDPRPHVRRDRRVERQDLDDISDSIRESIRQGVGAGVGTGTGIGVDIATGVVASVVQSVTNGVATGITGGVSGGITGGIVEGVTGGVTGAVDAVTSAVQDAAESVGQQVQRERKQPTERASREHDPRAAAALMEALKDSDKGVRETALSALVSMRDPRIVDPLTVALKDSDPDIRERAAFGLGQLRDPRAIDPLAGALHDSSTAVREHAAFALGQIRDRRAASPLMSALHDDSSDVRRQAAFSLGELRDPSAVDPLVNALKDSDANVREHAAFALGQIGDPRAIDGLTAALKDSNVSVRRQAAFALGEIR